MEIKSREKSWPIPQYNLNKSQRIQAKLLLTRKYHSPPSGNCIRCYSYGYYAGGSVLLLGCLRFIRSSITYADEKCSETKRERERERERLPNKSQVPRSKKRGGKGGRGGNGEKKIERTVLVIDLDLIFISCTA